MKCRILVLSAVLSLCYGHILYAEDLPQNPWSSSTVATETESSTENTATTLQSETDIVPTQASAALPKNPWQNLPADNVTYPPRKLSLPAETHRQAAVSAQNRPQVQRSVMQRNVGGVGRIGYRRQSRASQAKQDDTSSMFGGLFDSSSDNYTGAASADDTDFSFEAIKNKGMNQWHRATAPITNAVNKWMKDVKDLMK